MKEKLIENLWNEASEKVRLQRKTKQFMTAMKSLLILYITFCVIAVVFLPQSWESLSIMFISFGFAICLAIVIFLGGAIILPFGKSTKEEIDETFKELVSTRIKSKTEYLSKIKDSLTELEQELEVLKTI